MEWKLLDKSAQRTYIVVFETGDEVLDGLMSFANEESIDAASFTAVGAVMSGTLAYFEIDKKQYHDNPFDEQAEVLTLTGDVTRKGEGRQVHMHTILGRRDASTFGGHVKQLVVRPTLEVVITESPKHLQRTYYENVGLALIDLHGGAAE